MGFPHLTYFIAHELNCHSKHNKRQVWRKLSPAAEGNPPRGDNFRSNTFSLALLDSSLKEGAKEDIVIPLPPSSGSPKKDEVFFWGEVEGGAERM